MGGSFLYNTEIETPLPWYCWDWIWKHWTSFLLLLMLKLVWIALTGILFRMIACITYLFLNGTWPIDSIPFDKLEPSVLASSASISHWLAEMNFFGSTLFPHILPRSLMERCEEAGSLPAKNALRRTVADRVWVFWQPPMASILFVKLGQRISKALLSSSIVFHGFRFFF